MHGKIVLRQVTRGRLHLTALADPGNPDLYLGADAIEIAAQAPRAHRHPVSGARLSVLEGKDAAPRRADHRVEVTVTVQVTGRQRPRFFSRCKPVAERSGA